MKRIPLFLFIIFSCFGLQALTIRETASDQIEKARIKNRAVVTKALVDALGEKEFVTLIARHINMNSRQEALLECTLYFLNGEVFLESGNLSMENNLTNFGQKLTNSLRALSDTVYLVRTPQPYEWGKPHIDKPVACDYKSGAMTLYPYMPIFQYFTNTSLYSNPMVDADMIDMKWFRHALDAIGAMTIPSDACIYKNLQCDRNYRESSAIR